MFQYIADKANRIDCSAHRLQLRLKVLKDHGTKLPSVDVLREIHYDFCAHHLSEKAANLMPETIDQYNYSTPSIF